MCKSISGRRFAATIYDGDLDGIGVRSFDGAERW